MQSVELGLHFVELGIHFVELGIHSAGRSPALSTVVEERNAFLLSESLSHDHSVVKSILTLCERGCGSIEMADSPKIFRNRLFCLCGASRRAPPPTPHLPSVHSMNYFGMCS